MATNPFEPWLKCYASGAVSERPWWRQRPASPAPLGSYIASECEGASSPSSHWSRDFVRCDGVWTSLAMRNRPSRGGGAGGMIACAALDPCDPVNIGPLATIDAANPIPVPLPMSGQVWIYHGRQRVIEDVECDYAPFRFGADPERPRYPHTIASIVDGGAILVYGPSQYGANVPWAPAGWKP